MRDEPVITAAGVVGAILTIITGLMAFGVINWTPEQMGSFEAVLISIVPIVLSLVGGYLARSKVTPVNNPKDSTGRKLAPVATE